jgi:hypothetical protein
MEARIQFLGSLGKHKILLMVGLSLLGFVIASFTIAQFWWAFLIVGVLLFVSSFTGNKTEIIKAERQILSAGKEGGELSTSQFLIPQTWDPNEIGIQVRRLQNNASVARVYVDSVIKRFVIGQDNQTAKVRIEFLKSKLEELTLSKELQSSLDELEFRRVKLEIEQLELEKKRSGLKLETERMQEIAELERQRDALKIKVEIAHLVKQMDEARNPPQKDQSPSAEETKRANRENREKKLREIRDCEAERLKVQADSMMTEDSRRRLDNILAKKIERLHDELEQYI